ncbi:MAG: ATP-binding cassette domain-containing protein [Planctomycetota bacterium]|nr:MAG: ATP-binding cassette domain-containing protein [Planctomycetota bacterium]
MIEVRNLNKSYGAFPAVKGISFTVDENEIVGFLGPNGAGKTTTIRILTCYQPATSGEARVGGHDVFRESMQVRRIVGYLPESVPLYHEMRVREYLRFRGRLRGLDRPQREAAIARVAERCWITDVIDRPIGQLSKGYRQRVGLADALLHNPKVLILDEPTVGLDPTQIRETRTLIRELAQDHTVMLSSHILPEVEVTCRRIIIISRGEIVASGTPQELRERLAGEADIVVEIKAPENDIVAGLKQLDGVSAVRTEVLNGWLRAHVASKHDVREQVHQLSVKRGWPLRELRRDVASLEDFFVKIVAEAGAGAAPRRS